MANSSMLRDGRAGARSHALFESAQQVIPGGVNSPVRAFKSVGGEPPFVKRAEGARIWTEDGACLIDYVGSWGPAILGHAHPEVVDAVIRAARDGLSFGAPTAAEIELASMICERVPSCRDGMVRLCNSGTEATMSALRVARGFTGRDKIVKTDGAYHGHADTLLVAAGSGAATLGIPGSAGVPDSVVADTLLVPWNDVGAVEALVERWPDDIAAIIIEPVVGNMGCVPPRPGYLERLREITAKHEIVLIFDEVMTGFRVARGGAQERYGVTPDMTTLGKIVGGGMPIGAYGGKREIMQRVAPLGPVYQAGTLSGNPVAVAAGITTLTLDRDLAVAAARAPQRNAVRRPGRARRASRPAVDRHAGGLDVHRLLPARRGVELRRRQAQRHRPVRRVLPRDAGARRVPRAVAVRGCVPVRGPRRRRHRRDPGRGGRGHGRGRGVALSTLLRCSCA
ncbi:MAG: glutamate-1-semialdehyde 2,1-aminomutase [Nannocystaceae bacterium]